MSEPSETKLQGKWLTIARIGWAAFFSFALLSFLLAIFTRWATLMNPSAQTMRYLDSLGWDAIIYAVYSLATEGIFTALYFFVGLIIFTRRSDERMAIFTSFTLIAFGVGNRLMTPTIGALQSLPYGGLINAFFGFAAYASFTQFPYLFPNGFYVPTWARVPALIWFVFAIAMNFAQGSYLDPTTWSPTLLVLVILPLWSTILISQVYRYRYTSNQIERQQTKWVVFALSLIVIAVAPVIVVLSNYGLSVIYEMFTTEFSSSQAFALGTIVQAWLRIIYLFLPIGFAFSILRYRLWDIDVIIRKTLVYGALSAQLALVYFGGVTLLGSLFSAISGQQSTIAIVISTLAIAALFNPLRRRVQDFIDRRFYRKKFNAERILADFASIARDEVDIEKLTGSLIGAVNETLHPKNLSLWVRK